MVCEGLERGFCFTWANDRIEPRSEAGRLEWMFIGRLQKLLRFETLLHLNICGVNEPLQSRIIDLLTGP